MGYCSLFVAGSPEPYGDNGNSPTLLNNNPLTSGDWLALNSNYMTDLKRAKKILCEELNEMPHTRHVFLVMKRNEINSVI